MPKSIDISFLPSTSAKRRTRMVICSMRCGRPAKKNGYCSPCYRLISEKLQRKKPLIDEITYSEEEDELVLDSIFRKRQASKQKLLSEAATKRKVSDMKDDDEEEHPKKIFRVEDRDESTTMDIEIGPSCEEIFTPIEKIGACIEEISTSFEEISTSIEEIDISTEGMGPSGEEISTSIDEVAPNQFDTSEERDQEKKMSEKRKREDETIDESPRKKVVIKDHWKKYFSKYCYIKNSVYYLSQSENDLESEDEDNEVEASLQILQQNIQQLNIDPPIHKNGRKVSRKQKTQRFRDESGRFIKNPGKDCIPKKSQNMNKSLIEKLTESKLLGIKLNFSVLYNDEPIFKRTRSKFCL